MNAFINIGHFHPLVVHLPIGILIFTFLLELFNRKNRDSQLSKAIKLGLVFSFLTAALSSISGIILSNAGDYPFDQVIQHRNNGFVLTILIGLAIYFNSGKTNTYRNIYIGILSTSIFFLILTGHQGGTLTHGEGFLTSKEEPIQLVNNIHEVNSYENIIKPIIKRKCQSCHNPSKRKGKLDMSSMAGLIKGGKTGELFGTELLFSERIHMPIEVKKHMPPKGKLQLSKAEISVFDWWIENEACFDCIPDEMKGTDAISSIIERYSTSSNTLPAIDTIEQDKLLKLNSGNVVLTPISINSPWLSLSLREKANFNSRDLKRLKQIAANISSIDFSDTPFSDKDAKFLKYCKNVQTLHLQNSNIGSKTMQFLSNAQHLKVLNIYGTEVNDAAYDDIKSMTALQKLYCWQSALSEDTLSRMQLEKPLLEIVYQIDENIFADARLKSPQIQTPSSIFKDSVQISLSHNLKGSVLYYTLDGSKPDTNALKYLNEPISIKESSLLQAIATKKNWVESHVNTAQMIKIGHAVDQINLSKPPHASYPGKGGQTLIDFETGTTDFRSDKWIAYQAEHVTANLQFSQAKEISSVVVSALESTPSWIFFPTKIKVFTSTDGANFTFNGDLDITASEPNTAPETQFFQIDFSPVTTQYLKIEIESPLTNPDWHLSPGGKSWVFLDEIMIN